MPLSSKIIAVDDDDSGSNGHYTSNAGRRQRQSSSSSSSSSSCSSVLPLHQKESNHNMMESSSMQQQQQQYNNNRPGSSLLCKRSSSGTAAPSTTAPSVVSNTNGHHNHMSSSSISANDDDSASSPGDGSKKQRVGSSSSSKMMELMKERLFSFSSGISLQQPEGMQQRRSSSLSLSHNNQHQQQHQQRRPSSNNTSLLLVRRGSNKRRGRTNFMAVMGGVILLACCSSVLYLASTMTASSLDVASTVFDHPPETPILQHDHRSRAPPHNNGKSKWNKPSNGIKGETGKKSLTKRRPRVVGLVSKEQLEHNNNNNNASSSHQKNLLLAMPKTNHTAFPPPPRQYKFQYHRIRIPRDDKLLPTYDDAMLLPPNRTTWEDVLDLPVVVAWENDHDHNVDGDTAAVAMMQPPISNGTASSSNNNNNNATTAFTLSNEEEDEEEEPVVRDDNMQAEILDDGDDSNISNEQDKTCKPMAEWMTATFSNCNTIHEIDMLKSSTQHDQSDLKLLGQGWFRGAWKYDTFVSPPPDANATTTTTTTIPVSPLSSQLGSTTVILKTLRMEREFLEEYFDLHRRDAVAMERLTFSPFVIDVYGYCGQSALNEFADGVAGGRFQSLEQVNRAMRGKESDPNAMRIKLQLATSIAIGLAHVHNVYVGSEPGHTRRYSTSKLIYGDHAKSTTGFGDSLATMSHSDFNPRNIAMMSSGKPKLNDFNIAEFMTYNVTTNESCGFRSRLHEPWWRAPEEMDMSHSAIVNEKVDVYALGNVLFHILTTHAPRGKMKKERMDEVREIVRNGTRPAMLEPYATGEIRKNRITKAFKQAMDLCYEADPTKRGTSVHVAKILHKALKREEEENKNTKKTDSKADQQTKGKPSKPPKT